VFEVAMAITDGASMPGITSFPTVVTAAVEEFGDIFVYEPERRHFAEYLTGLMVAARKTVRGMNSEFAMTTDQSCFNRFLTEVEWDEEKLNEERLKWLQKDSSTQYTDRGVIAIDNVLIDHDGKLIEDVASPITQALGVSVKLEPPHLVLITVPGNTGSASGRRSLLTRRTIPHFLIAAGQRVRGVGGGNGLSISWLVIRDRVVDTLAKLLQTLCRILDDLLACVESFLRILFHFLLVEDDLALVSAVFKVQPTAEEHQRDRENCNQYCPAHSSFLQF